MRPLIFAVKQWASRRGVKDASRGYLSSYSFVLLVVFFLQAGVSPPVLPHLQSDELTRGGVTIASASASPSANGWLSCKSCGKTFSQQALRQHLRNTGHGDSGGHMALEGGAAAAGQRQQTLLPRSVHRAVVDGFDCTFCDDLPFARAALLAQHAEPNTMSVGELLGACERARWIGRMSCHHAHASTDQALR